ncbi:MAG: 3-deoxy-D-manno-octulosonic acid transferase [Candidatus Omnitrophica bacterium]|nr:3-deoxy-D-manno-octulosonic acid transferase [Candidatus Omnitrophota bacterium]
MIALYDIAFIIFGIIYLPYLIVTKRYRYGFLERLGFLPEAIKSKSSKGKIIWLHAVSMGEMKTASILAPLLRKTFPRHTLLFSSVTHTGNKVARTIATREEGVFYLPFDISFITDRVVRTLKPELFLCLETELWPNLISSLHKASAKIILVNGRISNRSYFSYRKIKFIISGILQKFCLMLMQSEQDAVRILTLGSPKDRVHVTGNLKFDLLLLGPDSGRKEIRSKLRLQESDILFVAGSTHRGEDEIILECYSGLKKEYQGLRLLIAPRHVERTQEIEDLIAKNGFHASRYSRLSNDERRTTNDEIFILDTIGNLKTIYAAADIVFIGGSLVRKGGQNPIEPASLSRPVIIGKFMFNFQDIVMSFIENEACVQVGDKEELCSSIRLLMTDPTERKKIGLKARGVVEKNSGSSQRTVDLILTHLNL